MVTQQNARPVTALLGTKLGMTQVWDDDGRLVPVTVVAGRHQRRDPGALRRRRTATPPSSSPTARSTRARSPSRSRATSRRPASPRAGTSPRSARPNAAEFTLGQEITAEVFEAGQLVDVIGTTKGKGTAGVMKRHGFHGVGASHGAHRNHRKPGSIGGASTPSRVFKGVQMAGRMGPTARPPRT